MPFQPGNQLFGDTESDLCRWLAGQPEMVDVTVTTDLTGWDGAVTANRKGHKPTPVPHGKDPKAVEPLTGVIRLQRVSSTSDGLYDSVWLQVDCFASTRDIAHDLAQMARALLTNAAGTAPNVVSVRDVSGPHPMTDLEPEHPRWVFDIQVAVRGTALR